MYMGKALSYTAALNITNPGGLSASQSFPVGSSRNLQPAISSIAPNPVPWEQATTLTVSRSNFQSGFTASVNVGGTKYPSRRLTTSQNFRVSSTTGGNLQPAINSITPNPVHEPGAVGATDGRVYSKGLWSDQL